IRKTMRRFQYPLRRYFGPLFILVRGGGAELDSFVAGDPAHLHRFLGADGTVIQPRQQVAVHVYERNHARASLAAFVPMPIKTTETPSSLRGWSWPAAQRKIRRKAAKALRRWRSPAP